MQIIESLVMTKTVEDWSRVRSPSRARRRLRHGYRQNIVVRQVPRTDAITLDGGASYVMHPEAAKEFRRMVDAKIAAANAKATIKPRSDTANPLYLGWVSPTLTWGGPLFSIVGVS